MTIPDTNLVKMILLQLVLRWLFHAYVYDKKNGENKRKEWVLECNLEKWTEVLMVLSSGVIEWNDCMWRQKEKANTREKGEIDRDNEARGRDPFFIRERE